MTRLYIMRQPPVVLFNFNRPDQTLRVLEQLTRLKCEKVYLVCDGPRHANSADEVSVGEVRKHLAEWEPPGIKVLIEAELNMGLRSRFYSALDYVFDRETSALVLEDDCGVDDSFFEFAAKALDVYEGSHLFGIVAAHNPMPSLRRNVAQFDDYPRIWGWAIHGILWKKFRASPRPDYLDPIFRRSVLGRIGSRTMRVMFGGMMTPELSSRTWDVDFATYCISEGLLNVSPPTNLCLNFGLDGKGTHQQDWSALETPKTRPYLTPMIWREARKPSFWRTASDDLRRILRWVNAGARRPHLALRKLLSLVNK